MPRGMATARATTSASTASSSVTGNRANTASRTEIGERKERQNSAWGSTPANEVLHRQRPVSQSCWRHPLDERLIRVQSGPRMSNAGSPITMLIKAKVATEMREQDRHAEQQAPPIPEHGPSLRAGVTSQSEVPPQPQIRSRVELEAPHLRAVRRKLGRPEMEDVCGIRHDPLLDLTVQRRRLLVYVSRRPGRAICPPRDP